MIRMDTKAEIRHAVLVEGKSRRQVAKETGHSRNTIRVMVEDSSKPKYVLSKARESRVLGTYHELLSQWVAEDEEKPKKKRRTTVRMYALLKERHGYVGAESSLRGYVGKLRRKARHKVYIPLAYAPGETGQVDFGEADVQIGGRMVTVQLFVMWLGYSGAMFMQAYPAANQEVFFAGHVAALGFFGGVCAEIWYDNLKDAVAKVLKGRGREEQDSFISFRTHYLFQAEFCNVNSGWEKGGVEGKVGYCRRNWLIDAGEFESWASLNAYLRERCLADQERHLPGRSQSIREQLEEERVHFRPLPAQAYACCKTVPVRANHLSLVTYATNRYSVPTEKSHEALTLRAYVDRIEISVGSELVASHARCWERKQDVLNPHHYLTLLARRPRAFAHAKPIRQWQESWPQSFDRYLAGLKDRFENMEATRTFIEILQLGQNHPETVLADVLEEALVRGCYRVAEVGELLRRQTEAPPPTPAPLPTFPHLADIRVAMPNLQQFDQLLPNMRGGQA
jgi:transposase